METSKVSNNDNYFFTVFSLFWVFLGWLGFILSLSGLFYFWIFILCFAAGIYFAVAKKIFSRISGELRRISLFLLAIVFIFSLFVTPTIFSGRDQGSFSEAAIRLAQNKQLEFSTPASDEFFKIYGPGKALNFPGFHYVQNGNLITQFPIPYVAWLGIFYSIFGISGLIIANSVLLYLFLLSFYLIGKLCLKSKFSKIPLALILTSFSFLWFFKFTLSENIALALVWMGILQLMLFMRNKESLFFISAFFTFGLLVFARIEGFAIFAMFILVLLFNGDCRKFLSSQKVTRVYLPVLFLTAMAILTLIINLPFFKEIGKALLKNASAPSLSLPLADTALIFANYGILQYAVLGIISIAYFLIKKKNFQLLPFFIVLPVFIYLIDSNISPDHPWMLRRFVFAILPALILYSSLLLAVLLNGKKKLLPLVLAFAALLVNLPAFLAYFSFAENRSLLPQTEAIARNFSENDLVLVDRLASGDGWSMMSGPMSFLYGRNSAYFFNPDDLEKINTEKFDRIYIITPDQNIDFYKNSPIGKYLKDHGDYSIEAIRLKSVESSLTLPKIKKTETNGKIFEVTR